MSSRYVIDTSVVIKWFSEENEDLVSEARKIYVQILQGEIEAWAPSFLLVELANILTRKKKLTERVTQQAIEKIKISGIHFVDLTQDDIKSLVSTAHQYGITVYDALYLILAQEKKAKLLTADEELLDIQGYTTSLEEVS